MVISAMQYVLYLQYMLCGLILTALFGAAYVHITPARELWQIRQGNVACALSFGGALIGFCLALASSIAHSVNLIDFIVWGFAAAVIQILVYFAATRLVPSAHQELERNNVAVGAFFAALSLGIGLLNAACLTS